MKNSYKWIQISVKLFSSRHQWPIPRQIYMYCVLSVVLNVDICLKVVVWVFFSLLDEDGDLIAFSTGEELLEALGFVDNGLFRVFVKPSK